ncbi:MAG TPA: Fe-Mn family superoxide dismutase [bacterium]|jgi:Fe-Mn family superoxide dismutase|nr:Fe-Mn family superoxide dismutase [bacterium]
MPYTAKNYNQLLGMSGFSDKMLKTHFKLYEGYVAHINEMIEFLNDADKETQAYDEVKRRFAWEFNGMRLHEAYFGNMTKSFDALSEESDFARQIKASFGSMEAWKKDFVAVSSMRGIGWAVLAWDPEGKKLFNVWINEHDTGYLFYSVPLLVSDVFEHAYWTDYGMERKIYIEVFMKVIDWKEVQRRFESVVRMSNAHAS